MYSVIVTRGFDRSLISIWSQDRPVSRQCCPLPGRRQSCSIIFNYQYLNKDKITQFLLSCLVTFSLGPWIMYYYNIRTHSLGILYTSGKHHLGAVIWSHQNWNFWAGQEKGWLAYIACPWADNMVINTERVTGYYYTWMMNWWWIVVCVFIGFWSPNHYVEDVQLWVYNKYSIDAHANSVIYIYIYYQYRFEFWK